jgi:two-component system, chemotaxis family, sensor histidine kinase and response regulator WspE
LAITISDDGRGIDVEKLRAKIVERKLTTQDMASRMTDPELYEFLFLPGFSTKGQVTELSGRGVGLDVVHTMATSVGGSVRVQSRLGRGTSFHLNLPITLSVIRAVLVEIAGEPYAFPLNRIDRLLRVAPQDIASLEHRQFLRVDGQNVGVVLATQILRMSRRPPPASAQFSTTPQKPEDLFVVLFSNHGDQYGLLVDHFLGEQDLVVRPLDHRLGKVPNISAAAVLDDGNPALIVDVDDVRRAIERLLESGKLERTDEGGRTFGGKKKRVLVVDDSITVREVERQLLASRGYEVTVAVDGADGWNTIRDGEFDLVISDIDMPHMNGFEFTRRIKDDAKLKNIPVVIVSYKDREEDRLRGLEAGANYYLTKGSFHDETLLSAVSDLIGEAES